MSEPITILVADDDEDVRLSLTDLLRSKGYNVAEAANTGEAFSKTVELRPDLLILDVEMPPEDGYAVCRAIRGNAATSKIPILMLTCHGLVEERTAGLRSGADDYVIKPCYNDELLARIEALFRRYPPKAMFFERLEHAQSGIKAAEEFRRYIVVLNVDVKGSSSPPPSVHEEYQRPLVYRDYHEIVDSAVAKHGGSEVAWAGDGGTAEFSEPDPAVAASIAILKASARHPRVSNLVLRIGVAGGMELLEPTSLIGKRTSQTHNRAGHLQKYSGLNNVCIDSDVFDAISCKDLFIERSPVDNRTAYELKVFRE
jgi:CheY-like chemotaxis protein